MKKIHLFIAFFLSACFCTGQTANLFQKKGDSLYKLKEYKNAAIAFSAASRLMNAGQSGLLFRTRLSAARCWSLSNDPDSAFAQIDSISLLRPFVYNSLITIMNEKDLVPLHKDQRWEKMTKKLFDSVTKETRYPLDSTYTQQEIIYGRKDGMALTMLQLKPKHNSINRGIILVRSGGWGSSFYMANTAEALPYLQNGYTIFIVFHGSEPVYTITDAIEDIQRAVRFVRYNAITYSVNPDKLGMLGISAGGHLSLISGLIDSSFVINSPDPVDRVSSKVQAVVSFYPVSDFLNWNAEGQNASSADLFKHLNHLLEFRKWNAQRRQFNDVTDSTEWKEILKQISPINHLTSNDAPVLIFHGDDDDIVPFGQTELLVKKMEEIKIPVSFIKKKGYGHGWARNDEEMKMIMDWFNTYLK